MQSSGEVMETVNWWSSKLATYYDQFMAFAQANPVVAGAVSLWGLAVVSFFLRGIPSALYGFFYRNLVVEIHLNNGDWMQEYAMYGFLEWFSKTKWTGFSRSMSVNVNPRSDEEFSLSAGFGTHFFFYRGSFMWFIMSKEEASATSKVKTSLVIRKLGFRKHKLKLLLNDFYPKSDEAPSLYSWHDGSWDYLSKVSPRSLDSVAMDPDLRHKMETTIDAFENSRDWYYRRGMAYKLAIMFHGKPGTGKSSLLRAIASHWGRNIATASLNQFTDESFRNALMVLPTKTALIIEDMDTFSCVKPRGSKTEKVSLMDDSLGGLTLSGILNAMDGVASLDDVIILMTTNHIESIDPAILRKGRTDFVFEIGALSPEVVKQYAEYIFPHYDFKQQFRECLGCELHEALIEAREDPDVFAEMLSVNTNTRN